MTRLGVINNPRSFGNGRGGLWPVAKPLRLSAYAEPRTLPELGETLAEYRREGVEVIAVGGGDGTLRDVLTALSALAYAPTLALLPSGRTNLAAVNLGLSGNAAEELARLAAAGRAGALHTVDLPVLDVVCADRRLRGFVFGAAAFAAGHRFATQHVQALGGALAAAAAIAWGIGGIVTGQGRDLLRGEDAAVMCDGLSRPAGRRFLVLATPLERLVLGMRPFWGEGEGAIRWLDIAAPPRRPAAALMPVLRGRPRPWMREAGYDSGRCHRLTVELSRPFILDGEAFPAVGAVTLSADARIRFVSR